MFNNENTTVANFSTEKVIKLSNIETVNVSTFQIYVLHKTPLANMDVIVFYTQNTNVNYQLCTVLPSNEQITI